MKHFFTALMALAASLTHGQDVNLLMKEASNLEKQMKEPEALEKYKQVAAMDTTNVAALVKCTELSCSIGARLPDKNVKTVYYNSAKIFAAKAVGLNPNNAEANYAMSLVTAKLTETETEKKQVAEYVRLSKAYADRAYNIDPNNARINYLMGKWHLEMVNLSWIKKVAVKTLYGGLPKGNIDSAIYYMEKCKALDPYFVRNYFDLAKAYESQNQVSQEINVLNKLVKLPIRTADDAALREEGKKMLDQLL